MHKIIFATGNRDKMTELREILADLPYEVCSMKELGLDPEIDENGSTFRENSEIKVRTLYDHIRQYAPEYADAILMADDSGLVIDAMPEELGVRSARFMGEDTPYDIKLAAILKRMEGVKGEARSARFCCVISAMFPDGRLLAAEGVIEGLIHDRAAGTGGFGYDPIFYVPSFGCTTAELPADVKNAVSHRGEALRIMKEQLRKSL